MDKLFFKVWRNIVLKNLIIKYLREYRNEIDYCLYDFELLNGRGNTTKIKNVEKIENLSYSCDRVIQIPKLLNNFIALKRIKFTNNSLAAISGKVIPESVKVIIYPIGNYQISTNTTMLSKSVHTIKNVCFIKKKNDPYYENKIIIPSTLKTIIFGKNSKFNIEIVNGLIDKNGGDGYCNGVKCSFPSSLKTLDLGISWNNNDNLLMDGTFCNGLTSLNLGGYNNDLLFGVIPTSVTDLTLHHPLLQRIPKDVIPDSVLSLHIKFLKLEPTRSIKLTADSFPKSLTHLILETSKLPIKKNSIPNSVVYIKMCDNINIKIVKRMLPNQSLHTLIIPDSSSILIEDGALTQSIKTLEFAAKARTYANINETGWNQLIDIGFFPNSLTTLYLGDGFNQFLKPGLLPPTLLNLRLGRSFNSKLIIGSLPNTLQKLIFSEDSEFNQPIDEIGILPSSLIHLELNSNFNQPISIKGILPNSISILILPKEFNPLIPKHVIPSNIEYIRYLNFF